MRFFLATLLLLTVQIYAQVNTTCDTSNIGNGNNLGIYGGIANDITYNNNGRLFANCAAPASLFISDDTAKTWYKAFPRDSMEFECGTRGWGGGGRIALSNQKNWVAEFTNDTYGDISAAVISFQNGDTGTWHTAMDGVLFEQMGYTNGKVFNIGMSDYYLYTLFKNYIVRIDTGKIDSSDIINIYNRITSIDSSASLISIAVANTASGYPFYVVIDSSGSTEAYPNGQLYKYDGSIFTKIPIPSTIRGLSKVFTHQAQITGDTIFISGKNSSSKPYVYRSFDGGSTWTNITQSPNFDLIDVNYSPNWVSQMPASNGLILINSWFYISKDMGITWSKSPYLPELFVKVPYAVAIHPADTNLVVCSSVLGLHTSTGGITGTYTKALNDGLEAALVRKIVHNKNETEFYLGTSSGLAYTTKYKDDAVVGIDKWMAPNGKFPIDSTNLTGGASAVAIDQDDSAHVIAGYNAGFFVSSTGPDGFQKIVVSGYLSNSSITKDIEFISSDIVLSVTGSSTRNTSGMGDIWRSTDRGYTWTKVSPSNFGNGTTIAIGFGKTDTVIYVGTGVMNEEHGHIWKSTDLGLTWTDVNTGPYDYYSASNTALTIDEIEVDPRGTDTLYIVAGYDSTSAFVKSIDGGLTYQYLNLQPEKYSSSLEIDASNPDSIIYVANARSVFQYNPALDTATRIFDGLPGENINDVAIGSILVGTTTGFYRIKIDTTNNIITNNRKILQYGNNDIFIYPVPAKDQLFIKLNDQNIKSNHITIYVYNIIGNKIAEKNTSQNNEIEISNLRAGTYIVRVIADDKEYAPKKIVITK